MGGAGREQGGWLKRGCVNLLPPGGHLTELAIERPTPFSQKEVSTCLARGQRDRRDFTLFAWLYVLQILENKDIFVLFFLKEPLRLYKP